VKQDDADSIDSQMRMLKEELSHAATELDEHYRELKSAARDRLRHRCACIAEFPCFLSEQRRSGTIRLLFFNSVRLLLEADSVHACP
jgi:hypothetical protein